MGHHLIDGELQSDKYGPQPWWLRWLLRHRWCPRGFVPLKLTDPMAQPVLWEYARVRRAVDEEFSDDLCAALKIAGYVPAEQGEGRIKLVNGKDDEIKRKDRLIAELQATVQEQQTEAERLRGEANCGAYREVCRREGGKCMACLEIESRKQDTEIKRLREETENTRACEVCERMWFCIDGEDDCPWCDAERLRGEQKTLEDPDVLRRLLAAAEVRPGENPPAPPDAFRPDPPPAPPPPPPDL